MSNPPIGRIWKAHGLKPHLSRTFKLSNDRQCAEKLEAIVGLYLNPPEQAVVVSCNEKISCDLTVSLGDGFACRLVAEFMLWACILADEGFRPVFAGG